MSSGFSLHGSRLWCFSASALSMARTLGGLSEFSLLTGQERVELEASQAEHDQAVDDDAQAF